MKEKPLELLKCFVPDLGGLKRSLVTSSVFSLRELSTDLKNTDVHFYSLGKTTGFRNKTLQKHIYENCKILFF